MNDKKETVLKIAMQEFSAKGYTDAKISHIAKLSGMGTGSIYLYFDNKEQILEEIFMRSFTMVADALREFLPVKEITAEEKLRRFIRKCVKMASEQKELAIIMLHEFRFWNDGHSGRLNDLVRDIRKMIKTLLQEGKRENLRQDLDSSSAGIFVLTGLWNVLAYKTGELNSLTLPRITNELENLIVSGLK